MLPAVLHVKKVAAATFLRGREIPLLRKRAFFTVSISAINEQSSSLATLGKCKHLLSLVGLRLP